MDDRTEEDEPLRTPLGGRNVFLAGEITPKKVTNIMRRIARIESESSGQPIQLFIHSEGGVSSAAFTLCDFITFFVKSPVHAVVFGECSSAATFVLLACERRVCTPFSTFVIHSGVAGGIKVKIDGMTEKNLRDLLDDLTTDSRKVIRYYAKHLNLSEEETMKLVERGDQSFNNALDAEEAKRIGLITEIATEKITMFSAPA